jgi:hypothetical protein
MLSRYLLADVLFVPERNAALILITPEEVAHSIAVDCELRLWVVCSRSEQRQSLNAEPNFARFRGTVGHEA